MRRKGIFVIFALWLFVLLALFCLGLGFKTFIEIKKAKLFIDKTRAHQLAVSGIALAKTVLTDDYAELDYWGDDWCQPIEQEVDYTVPQNQGKLKVTISDESARVDINNLEQEELKRLFELQEMETYEEKAENFLNYTQGSEESEGDTKNAALAAVEELLLVKDFTSDDYNKVKDIVTVYGDQKVNINTASRELLEALITDNDAKAKIFAIRFAPGDEAEDIGYFSPDGWLDFVDTLSQAIQDKMEDMFKVNSDFFRIKAEAEVEGSVEKITCIMDRNSGKILYWNEQ